MSGRSEHRGGESEEVNDLEREEDDRAGRVLQRWRRVMRNLREMSDGQN